MTRSTGEGAGWDIDIDRDRAGGKRVKALGGRKMDKRHKMEKKTHWLSPRKWNPGRSHLVASSRGHILPVGTHGHETAFCDEPASLPASFASFASLPRKSVACHRQSITTGVNKRRKEGEIKLGSQNWGTRRPGPLDAGP